MKKPLSVAFAIAVMIACTTNGPEGPTTPPTSNTPVAEATPAPAPTPKPVVGTPAPEGLDVACLPGSTLVATYLGGASQAQVETWYTGFDNQNPSPRPGLQFSLLNIGQDVKRTFGACKQGDAAITGGKEYGCFFDKNGNPFKADNSPESNRKTQECRACVPTYTTRKATTYEGKGCERVRIETTYTLNSCTKEEAKRSETFKDAEPVYRTDSWFQVDNLSNGGSNYRIYDDKLAFPWIWRDNLTLAAGNQQTQFPHAANGAKLTLYWWPFLGIGAEKIGEAKAECAEIEDDWHGRVSFQCKRIDTCVQPQ